MKRCDRCDRETEHLNRMGFSFYGKEKAPYICHECCRKWSKLYNEKLKNPNKLEWVEAFEKWMKDAEIKVVFT